jgi:hypothetical protein
MKSLINSKEMIWIWKDNSVTPLSKLKNKDLRFLKFFILQNLKKSKREYWFGIHYSGYLEAIDQLLRINTKPDNNKNVIKTNRFLGELSNYFPNSKLSVQISQQIKSATQNKSVTNQPVTD